MHFHSINAFENVICEIEAILSRSQCVNIIRIFCRYSTPRNHTMMTSLRLVMTTIALLLSPSVTALSQEQLLQEITNPEFVEKYGHLVSLNKHVLVEPTGATCTQGNITLDRRYLPLNYSGPDVTYQCEANCSRTHQIPHKVLYRKQGKSTLQWRHNECIHNPFIACCTYICN